MKEEHILYNIESIFYAESKASIFYALIITMRGTHVTKVYMKVHILCNGRASNMYSSPSDLPFGGLCNTLSSKGDTLFMLARDNICCCFNCHSDLKQAYTWGRATLILQRNDEVWEGAPEMQSRILPKLEHPKMLQIFLFLLLCSLEPT